MPDFTFTGPLAYTYPDLRDTSGACVGTVEPGEIRDLGGAPDHLWRETTDEDRAAARAGQAAADPPAPGGGTPAGPPPAPPAILPQPPVPSATATQEG